ncbi:MAG: ATP-dependent zinc metalloprotease FtsH [Clostridiales bacterium]|nr:ATP-dependent zinc metalloprotease FtsH [Clostridiales bacterium]
MLSTGQDAMFLSQASRILFAASLILMLFIGFMKKEPEHAVAGGFKGSIAIENAQSHVHFSDVAANEAALSALNDLVDFLKEPEKYAQMGARIPHGVLLYGPPGTGKTLLARALAGEAGVPYFALSGSDFVEMYVGVGAKRVRELFSRARKAGKCVIFIDEIDAMGKKRDEVSSDEREQTLNALLSEMSGFKPSDGIIVLAATNRVDSLDPALLRPGRFDRQIEVGLPALKERLSILRLHAQNKSLAEEVDLEDIARNTSYFSGASLENLLNEAAIHAVRRGAERIEPEDMDHAYLKAIVGDTKSSRASENEKRQIAVHEAGHAIASRYLQPEHPIARISILPSAKGAAGYNVIIPKETILTDKAQLSAQIQVLLAGRAAESLFYDTEHLSTGAANDLMRATEIASAMVMELGLENEPYVSLRALNRLVGSSTNAAEVCKQRLQQEYMAVTALLEAQMPKLRHLTDALLEHEMITEKELDSILSIESEKAPA